MTRNLISPTTSVVGRKKTNFEQMPGRFPKGTFDRIDAVLEAGETRTDFLRVAVEREVRRRGRRPKTDEALLGLPGNPRVRPSNPREEFG